MIRIVHWAKFYPPDWGGMESVARDIATGSREEGCAVEVIAFSNDRTARIDVVDGVTVHRHPVSGRIGSQPISAGWVRSAIHAAAAADVVHIHVPNLLAACALPFVPRRPRIVLHWHADIIGKGFAGALSRPLQRYLLSRTDVVVATSERYVRSSAMLGRFADKIVVVPIGIADREPPASSLRGDIESFIAQRPLLLAVGRLVPYKGFDELVRAAAILASDPAIVIVGGGPEEGALRSLINQSGVGRRVRLVGRVDEEQLSALFDRAALYLMTSVDRAEAFGVVLLEAMAHGVPIVSTDIEGSGVGWVNADGISGLSVPPRAPVQFAAKIDRLLADPVERRRLAMGARCRFEENFTATAMTRAILEIYQDILNPGGDAQIVGRAF